MNWRVVDRFAGIMLSGTIFLCFTGYGVYVYLKTELWTHWYFHVYFIPIWMVVTAWLLGEVGSASLKEIIRIGRSYLRRWWSTAKEMWTLLKDFTMRLYNS
jgi:hypothetical protein